MPRSRESPNQRTKQSSNTRDKKKRAKLAVPAQQQHPTSPPRSPIRAGLAKVGAKLVQLSMPDREAAMPAVSSTHITYQIDVMAAKKAEDEGKWAKLFKKHKSRILKPPQIERYHGPDSDYQQLLDIRERHANHWKEMNDSEEAMGLYKKVMTGRASPRECQRMACIALQSLQGMPLFFQPVLGSYPPLDSTRRSADIPEHKFWAMELIENILKLCRPIDVLRLWQAHLTERIDAVIGLPKWQHYMGLSVDKEAARHVHIPIKGAFEEFGLAIPSYPVRSSKATTPGHLVEVELVVDQFRDFSKLGKSLDSTAKRMLIILPPVRKLEFDVRCCP